jgi:hypothetical protein
VNHFAFGKVLPQFLDACANAALKLATIEIKQDKKENVQFVDDGER